MKTVLIKLAEDVVNGGPNGLQCNERFRTLINEQSNLEECLAAAEASDKMLFVYATNMIKLIENGEFCIISETRSEENIINLLQTTSQKSKTYGQILMAMAQIINTKTNHTYITTTILDLMGLCLKILFQDNNNLIYLQNIISAMLPVYRIDEKFNTQVQTNLTLLGPRCDLDMNNINNFIYLLKVFCSMFEYITVQGGCKTYYEYRRNIYVFRNSYLAHFLQFGVQFSKLLFMMFSSNKNVVRPLLSQTLAYLQSVFMYPFTLSLHQFQVDEDLGQNITGVSSGDIYFPNYFRHVLCDIEYARNLLRYQSFVINSSQNFDEIRKQLNSIIKIIGRLSCPSQYTFKNEEQRISSRQFSLEVLQSICQPPKFKDSYYLHALLEIIHKIMTMFDNYFVQRKPLIIKVAMNFLYNIIESADLSIEDGKRSPFARTFQILAVCLEYANERLTQAEGKQVKDNSQLILRRAYQRITGNEADQIIQKYGINNPNEIECFSQLFQHIIPVFQSSLQDNLTIFQNLDENSLCPGAVIMWLHLCSQLLPKTQANLHQTSIILKYYRLAKGSSNLASLRYIKTLVEEVLSQCKEGTSTTSLWLNIQQLQGCSFSSFVKGAIQMCMSNFNCPNNQIIDYSLQFFKAIFFNLRKNDDTTFSDFYRVVETLLANIGSTVFSNPKFFHKRRALFNVISLIWVNSDNINYIYQIHKIITPTIPSTTDRFCQYLHDITGILEPVQKQQPFQVIAELAISDLQRLFAAHLADQNHISQFFNDPYQLKIFCKLALAFLSDLIRKLYYETHTDIPFKIHRLFSPYIKQICLGDYELPKNFATLLDKMVSLNPLAELIPINRIIPVLRQQSPQLCERLIRTYFQNLPRVGDIEWMYELVEQNIDFMVSWWEQTINRGLKPNINMRTIAEARLWSTSRQRQALAKLIFQVGNYDQNYWNVSGFLSQREFVNNFILTYT